MGENKSKEIIRKEVIDLISSSSSEYEEEEEEEDEEGSSPLRPMLVVKRNMDMKKVENAEDCFILDFDPFEGSIDLSKLSISGTTDVGSDDDSDLSIIAEKGKVACRDYPHPRHLCVKFPFQDKNSAHDSYCEQCYCYVCDLAAPCEYWIKPAPGHCHASEDIGDWKLQRKAVKQLKASSQN